MHHYVAVSITFFVNLSAPHFSPKAKEDGCLAHKALKYEIPIKHEILIKYEILILSWLSGADLPHQIQSFHLVQALYTFRDFKVLHW